MALSQRDRTDINDLIHLHGHLVDAGLLDEMGDLFTPDVTYDVTDLGGGTLRGVEAIREAALALGAGNPVGHHVTNVVITEIDDRSARVRSKGLGVRADGTTGSVVYDDLVTRGPGGWRIGSRKVTARRAPLGGPGPRDVLERLRRASIDRSAPDLARLYAADAVHEFPFTAPGLPSRLEGRDTIVRWITALWADHPIRYERYRTLAVHDTADPATIVVEQEAVGDRFALPNLLVLTVGNGEIVQLRDYVNPVAALERLKPFASPIPPV